MSGAAEAIVRHFKGDWHGHQGAIPAPGHSAKDRGVTVRDGDNGDVIFHAFNDADWRPIKDECRRVGLLPEWEPSRAEGARPVGNHWRDTGVFEYVGADGVVAYRTVRKEKRGEPKRFVAQRPDGKGGWSNGISGLARVLYRLPEILAADPETPVYLVEGERKADKLAGWGLVATAVAFGANGWRDEYATALAGRRVIIIPDNDGPGDAFATAAAACIARAGGDPFVIPLPGLPDKGDIMDWTGTAADLAALVDGAAIAPQAAEEPTLRTIDFAAWQGREAPAREWAAENWIPMRQATLLTGRGGVGKSLLSQQLATCVALGLPFLGVETRQMPALYVSCEDDADELWRRQGAICAGLGVTLAQLQGKLFLSAMAGEPDNHLATFDTSGKLTRAPRWREIEATCQQQGIGFVALDNASHMMIGDHNDLAQVAAFLNLLNSLAIARHGAVVILHHPNKAGADWLGSVAWENQVRSRLLLTLGDEDGDTDARTLKNPKANYAPLGGKLDFRWHRGAFVRDTDLPANMAGEIAENSKASHDNDVFLTCLRERMRQRRAVSDKHSASFAPTVFAAMPEGKGAGKARMQTAMDRLFRTGRIERAELWRGDDRKPVFGLRETAGDPARGTPSRFEKGAGDTLRETVRETRETVEQTADLRAGDAGNTHTTPKGGTGAASAAAPHRDIGSGRSIDFSRYERPVARPGMVLAPGEAGDDVEFR